MFEVLGPQDALNQAIQHTWCDDVNWCAREATQYMKDSSWPTDSKPPKRQSRMPETIDSRVSRIAFLWCETRVHDTPGD